MMPLLKKLSACIILLSIAGGCKEKYLSPVQSPTTGYLVVEGFINSGQSASSIKLTRTTKLYDSVNMVNEHNAIVTIEGENNEAFPLYENGNGLYLSSPLNLNDNEKYHLHIRTQDNKEYFSDFTKVIHTPDIDSISWTREGGGLKLYINTHDPQNNTRYYKWDYEETWEIHSTYNSSLKYVYDPNTQEITGVDYRDPITGAPDTTVYRCWRSTISTNINTGSSEKLSQDIIHLPLFSIEEASEKIGILYSINVRQYALSHAAYLFFQKIKKNTEQLGSVFDPQPSELQGNIHCTTNPNETVVGYVDISEEKPLRLFISNAQLPGWGYRPDCNLITVVNNPDSIRRYAIGLTPIDPVKIAIRSIVTFSASEPTCVDCTLRGTNSKPPFWP